MRATANNYISFALLKGNRVNNTIYHTKQNSLSKAPLSIPKRVQSTSLFHKDGLCVFEVT